MNKHLCIGPGGMGCPCCFPAPGSRERKLEFRRAKLREKRLALKEAEQELAPSAE
jgi:hypothetical protein